MAYAGDGPRPNLTAKLAIGFAAVAVVVVGIAIVVVATRGGSAPSPAAATPVRADGPEIVVVDARDVVRMDRGTVEPVTDRGGIVGVRINDPDLLATLRLESTDVITAISGKAVRRQFDVNDALAGASLANASTLYIELVRGGAPMLVKWELEGDLREARTGHIPRLPTNPFVSDPLSDTIKRLSELEMELPASTMLQIATNLQSGVAPGVRAVQAIRSGLVEGIKLYTIRPGSVWAALGLKNGDTILSANGQPVLLGTLADVLDRVKSATTIEVSIVRRGAPLTLKYSIVK